MFPEMLAERLFDNYIVVIPRRLRTRTSRNTHSNTVTPLPYGAPHVDSNGSGHSPRTIRSRTQGDESHGKRPRKVAGDGTQPDRQAVRQGLRHEDGRQDDDVDRGDLDRRAAARPGAGRRWAAAWPRHGDLRPGVVGEVDARHARRRRGPAQRWHVRLHRRRARDGSGLRQGDRRRHRPTAHLPARHR